MDSITARLQSCLTNLSLDDHAVGLVENVQAADIFMNAHKPSDITPYHLGTEYHRLKYIDETMPFIPARPISFNPDAPRAQQSVGHYVPIKSTLEMILSDKTYQDQVNCGTDCECFASVFSGTCFKTNKFFQDNPSAIPIILYSDGLCLTNPLNANAAKKNKLVGVYMTLGTVPIWNRSKVDSTQLVMVFNEKDGKRFGSEVIFKDLIEDLKGFCYNNKNKYILFGSLKVCLTQMHLYRVYHMSAYNFVMLVSQL
jgi:hypothetical protein